MEIPTDHDSLESRMPLVYRMIAPGATPDAKEEYTGQIDSERLRDGRGQTHGHGWVHEGQYTAG